MSTSIEVLCLRYLSVKGVRGEGIGPCSESSERTFTLLVLDWVDLGVGESKWLTLPFTEGAWGNFARERERYVYIYMNYRWIID